MGFCTGKRVGKKSAVYLIITLTLYLNLLNVGLKITYNMIITCTCTWCLSQENLKLPTEHRATLCKICFHAGKQI